MKKKLLIGALITILLSAIVTSSYNTFAGKIDPPKTTQDPNIGSIDQSNSIAMPDTNEKNSDEVLAIDNEFDETLPPNDLPDSIIEEPAEVEETIIDDVEKTNQNSDFQNNQQRGKSNGGGNQYRYKGNNSNSHSKNGINGQGNGANQP